MVKIVSLLPGSTEIVCALGFEDSLVGRSHECDYPASVRHLPRLTAPKFDPDSRSYEIDQRVRAILEEALSVYRIDAERLKSLAPDVILTQAQCEACAVSLDEVQRMAREWLDTPARIVALEPGSLEDVFDDIQRVAAVLGAPERGVRLVGTLRARMKAIATQTRRIANRPTVACIEWIDPLMAAGNWTPTLVNMAGGTNLFGESGHHAPLLDWDALRAADPDILIILPCGFDLATTICEMPALMDRPGWGKLRAVRDNNVFVTDGNQYFNRPGPRLIDSLEILAEIIHPDLFDFGHQYSGWQRL